MNPTGIILIFSAILGAALSGTGVYLIINSIVAPQGLLFEGIVMLSLGIIMVVLVTVASALGKTMITFGEIMTKQADIQKKLNSTRPEPGAAKPGGLTSIISEMLKNNQQNPDSISVQFLGDQGSGIKLDNPSEGSFDEKMDALKEKLSDAIKDDDYETAKEINQKIKELKDSTNDDSNDEKK